MNEKNSRRLRYLLCFITGIVAGEIVQAWIRGVPAPSLTYVVAALFVGISAGVIGLFVWAAGE